MIVDECVFFVHSFDALFTWYYLQSIQLVSWSFAFIYWLLNRYAILLYIQLTRYESILFRRYTEVRFMCRNTARQFMQLLFAMFYIRYTVYCIYYWLFMYWTIELTSISSVILIVKLYYNWIACCETMRKYEWMCQRTKKEIPSKGLLFHIFSRIINCQNQWRFTITFYSNFSSFFFALISRNFSPFVHSHCCKQWK